MVWGAGGKCAVLETAMRSGDIFLANTSRVLCKMVKNTTLTALPAAEAEFPQAPPCALSQAPHEQGHRALTWGVPGCFSDLDGRQELSTAGTDPDAQGSTWKAPKLREKGGEVSRGLTSTLLKVGEHGELACGREVAKRRAGRRASLQHPAGLAGAGRAVFTFPERMGVGGRRERGQLSKVCKTSFGIFSRGNGPFPKACSYSSTGLILLQPMRTASFTAHEQCLAGQKHLQFLLSHLVNESLQTRNGATRS